MIHEHFKVEKLTSIGLPFFSLVWRSKVVIEAQLCSQDTKSLTTLKSKFLGFPGIGGDSWPLTDTSHILGMHRLLLPIWASKDNDLHVADVWSTCSQVWNSKQDIESTVNRVNVDRLLYSRPQSNQNIFDQPGFISIKCQLVMSSLYWFAQCLPIIDSTDRIMRPYGYYWGVVCSRGRQSQGSVCHYLTSVGRAQGNVSKV